ncbi:MAG: peptidoglycan DD-metalloendopeptidase family protein [Gammaproteobacteria bacterium]
MAMPTMPASADAQPENAERLQALRQQIKTKQQDQAHNRKRQQALNQQLEALQTAINQLGGRLASLQQTQRDQNRQVDELRQRLLTEQAVLEKHRTLLAQLARRAYLNGQQEYLKLLLNQQDPADIQRMLSYYGYLQKAQITQITELQQAIDGIRLAQAELNAVKIAARETMAQITEQQAALSAQRQQRQTLLSELVVEYDDNRNQLEQLRKNEARLLQLLKQLEQQLADIPENVEVSFSAAAGKLKWPAKGKIKRRFGQARNNTGLRWQGVLIDSPVGGDVSAVHPGRVAYADWLRGFGLLVIVDHGDDYMTIYGHNQSLLSDVGNWVRQGEIIARSGQGGGDTEPGLYFEIRHRGKPTNPAKWCDG